MTQQQREAVAGMLRASPFDRTGDLRDQRPLSQEMIAAAPVPAERRPAARHARPDPPQRPDFLIIAWMLGGYAEATVLAQLELQRA